VGTAILNNTGRTRIMWQCRRGMHELDLLLEPFVAQNYNRLEETEKQALERLLNYPDLVLLDFLMGNSVPIDSEIADVVKKIRSASYP